MIRPDKPNPKTGRASSAEEEANERLIHCTSCMRNKRPKRDRPTPGVPLTPMQTRRPTTPNRDQRRGHSCRKHWRMKIRRDAGSNWPNGSSNGPIMSTYWSVLSLSLSLSASSSSLFSSLLIQEGNELNWDECWNWLGEGMNWIEFIPLASDETRVHCKQVWPICKKKKKKKNDDLMIRPFLLRKNVDWKVGNQSEIN